MVQLNLCRRLSALQAGLERVPGIFHGPRGALRLSCWKARFFVGLLVCLFCFFAHSFLCVRAFGVAGPTAVFGWQ